MGPLRLVWAEERYTSKRQRVMNEASLRNLTGVILILTPVAFNVFFTLLTVTFEYPDILREPTDRILRQFEAGGSGLVAIWYGFMLTAVLFVPVAVLVHKVLARQDTPYMAVATTFGVVAGVVQFLGLRASANRLATFHTWQLSE